MKYILRRIWRAILSNKCISRLYSVRHWRNVYKRMAKDSNTPVKEKCEGEELYIRKWKKISKNVSPIDFRLFSQFIGNNPSIVPEYVLHSIIEPVFLPRAYQQFYNDKNMYDKLLPKEYLAKSVFRCIDGICCGGGGIIL